jgi:hypothetical protein
MMTSIKDVDIGLPGSRREYLLGEEWFEQTYPKSYRRYGAPIELVWGPNHDALANALNEGATRLVYHSPEDRFYYWDQHQDAYCPVEPVERLKALLRAILRRAAEGMTRSEKIVWFQIWDEKAFRAVVDAARALLSVDHTFFHGEKSHRRFVDGQFIEPSTVESHQLFAERVVERDEAAILTVPEAWEGYWRFCSMHRLPPLRRTTFREKFRGETISRFGIGLRHDLKIGEKTAQGWRGLRLESVGKDYFPITP